MRTPSRKIRTFRPATDRLEDRNPVSSLILLPNLLSPLALAVSAGMAKSGMNDTNVDPTRRPRSTAFQMTSTPAVPNPTRPELVEFPQYVGILTATVAPQATHDDLLRFSFAATIQPGQVVAPTDLSSPAVAMTAVAVPSAGLPSGVGLMNSRPLLNVVPGSPADSNGDIRPMTLEPTSPSPNMNFAALPQSSGMTWSGGSWGTTTSRSGSGTGVGTMADSQTDNPAPLISGGGGSQSMSVLQTGPATYIIPGGVPGPAHLTFRKSLEGLQHIALI